MNKPTVILLLMLTLILAACSGNAANTAGPAAGVQGGNTAGELSVPMQVALGTIKLDGTDHAVTTEQAKGLLPLWETLQLLEGSDTAATEEKEALVSQIQETMTTEQMQAITSLNLSRQDMFSVMQSQVQTFGGAQNNSSSQGGASTNPGGGFGPGEGVFQGPPPDGGGFAGGDPSSQGQGQSQRPQAGDSTGSSNPPAAIEPNRIPTPLIQAVIEYLKTKAGL